MERHKAPIHRVILCKMGEEPVLTRMELSNENLQDFVGGYYRMYGVGPDIYFCCNEDGMGLKLPFNRNGMLGNFIVCAGHGTRDLSKDEVRKAMIYLTRYKDLPHPSMTGEPTSQITTFENIGEMREHLQKGKEAMARIWEEL